MLPIDSLALGKYIRDTQLHGTAQNEIDMLKKFDRTCLTILDIATVEISIITAPVSSSGPHHVMFIICHVSETEKNKQKATNCVALVCK